jgi:hypothetical protein
MNDRKFLAPLMWSFLCVDEGHRLKGIDNRLKQELTHYTAHEDGSQGVVCTKLLLTGTPLQNNLDELWCVGCGGVCVGCGVCGVWGVWGVGWFCLGEWVGCFVSAPGVSALAFPAVPLSIPLCPSHVRPLFPCRSLCNFVLPHVFTSLALFKTWFNFEKLNEAGAKEGLGRVDNAPAVCPAIRRPFGAVPCCTGGILPRLQRVLVCVDHVDPEGQEAVVELERENKVVSKLHAILSPFLLRRVKDEIALTETRLALPPKVRCVTLFRTPSRGSYAGTFPAPIFLMLPLPAPRSSAPRGA